MYRLERSLHQHIFKVGWLVTKNLRATTVFFYIFFLPGIILHEVIYWLVAGIVNVRAERAIAWPEAQSLAEMKLNFIRLGKNTHRFKVAIISIAPLLGGLAVIWLITNNVLNISLVVGVLNAGGDPIGALSLLLLTPDVWIWVYLMFAIANTMTPDRAALRGWRPVAIVLVVFVVVLYVIGLGQQVFMDNLAQPISEGLSGLALILGVIIIIDLIVTGVLGAIEAVIERISGNSATFQNGKLVAITREEMLREREQQRAKQERQRQQAKAQAATSTGGPPSIYKLPLPIPGAPGKESEPVTVRRDDKSVLPAGGSMPPRAPAASEPSALPRPAAPMAAPLSSPSARPVSPVIPGTVSPKADNSEDKQDAPIRMPAPRPSLSPTPTAEKKPPVLGRDDEDDDDEQDDKPSTFVRGTMPPRSPTPANRMPPAFNSDDEDVDDEQEGKRPVPVRGALPPRSPTPANKQSPAFNADDNDEEVDEEDKPPALVRGTLPPHSPVPASRKPPAFNSDDEEVDEESDDDKPSALVRGVMPMRSTTPPSRTPPAFNRDDEDAEDGDSRTTTELRPTPMTGGSMPSRSPLPANRKPPVFNLSEDDEDERSTMEIPTSSPARSPVPASRRPPIFSETEDEDEDEDQDEEDEDEDDERL